MVIYRPAEERGQVDAGWLKSAHSFSFGDYFDRNHMNLSVLRVINDDVIAAGGGFATHPHDNMEIITYVLEGELAHKDSMGNGSVIRPGEIQHMSAGSGITHSEFNPSEDNSTHLLQIWMLPNKRDVEPQYQSLELDDSQRQGRWKLLASPDGREGSLAIHCEGILLNTLLDSGDELSYELAHDRVAYLHVAQGRVRLNGREMNSGDAATIYPESLMALEGLEASDILLFDLPKEKE